MSRLSTTKQIRDKILELQKNTCPVCSRTIQPHEAVLDHDHKTGQVRAVLHRNCNQLESKIRGLFRRLGPQIDPSESLAGLMTLWHGSQYKFLHPDHLTTFKREARTLRKRLSQLKTEAARGRYKEELKSLREKHRAYMQEHCITEDQLKNLRGKNE